MKEVTITTVAITSRHIVVSKMGLVRLAVLMLSVGAVIGGGIGLSL